MSSVPYRTLIASPTFKFLVGSERTEFVIHTALVASQSDTLRTLVNGPFRETQNGYAELASVSEDTFITFAEFMYTGDYELPSPVYPTITIAEDSVRQTKLDALKRKAAGSGTVPSHPHWDRFKKDAKYGGKSDTASIPTLNANMDADYSSVFISQAKIFIFADCYGVDKLAGLSMYKLHRSLSGFRLNRARSLDVVALAEFCYDTESPERLRKLVAHYVACIAELLYTIESFVELIRQNGDFAADVNCAMAERLKLDTVLFRA